MKHLMIDIESYGNHTTGAVASIAGQFFSIDNEEEGPFFDVRVGLDSCLAYGLTVNQSCIHWWLQQSEEARLSLVNGFMYELPVALHLFSTFVKENRQSRLNLWSHSFDTNLLNHAYEKTGEKKGWHFREERDLRTLNMLHRELGNEPTRKESERKGAHDALSDVRYQIHYVRKMLQDIGVTDK